MTTYAFNLIKYLMLMFFHDELHTKYVFNENFKWGLINYALERIIDRSLRR